MYKRICSVLLSSVLALGVSTKKSDANLIVKFIGEYFTEVGKYSFVSSVMLVSTVWFISIAEKLRAGDKLETKDFQEFTDLNREFGFKLYFPSSAFYAFGNLLKGNSSNEEEGNSSSEEVSCAKNVEKRRGRYKGFDLLEKYKKRD